MKHPANANPIQPGERMIGLDVIRGVAIFGILVVNMTFFSAPRAYQSTMDALKLWPGDLDAYVLWLINAFFAGKFYTMFSFLFGLGMYIFLDRAEQKGNRAVPLFLRRMSVLFLFGLIHALLIWSGDILFQYAVLGFILVLFRKAGPKMLLTGAVVSVLITPVFSFLKAQKITFWIYKTLKMGMLSYAPAMAYRAQHAYGEGTYLDMVGQRWQDFVHQYAYFWSLFPPVFAMFLFGVWAGKKGIFHNVAAHLPLIRRVWIVTVVMALGIYYVQAHGGIMADTPSKAFLLQTLSRLSNASQCIAYITTMILLLQTRTFHNLLAPLAFIGRMAISNYLLTSLICTTIYYNYGLGLFNKVGPAQGLLITVLIYTILLVFSILWLSAFRFGPVEWLWRTLTYGKLQPMKLKAKPAASSSTTVSAQ
jgi:uncharacterized protein